MSQLENTQTVVLQQADGKKIYLDLNVSTDTTAIESFKQASLVSEKAFEKSTDISNASFDYATGIAVFLALCATALAYWFGARSFKLTEMSFKTVSDDIKQAAESHSQTTLNLIENQEKLKLIDINEKRIHDVRTDLFILENDIEEIKYILQFSTAFPTREICSDDEKILFEKLNNLRKTVIKLNHLIKSYNFESIEKDVEIFILTVNTLIFDIQNKEDGYKISIYNQCLGLSDLYLTMAENIYNYLRKAA